MCEDYRASSPGTAGGLVPRGPDYTLDKADFGDPNGKRVKCETMVLWGKKGGMRFYDVKKEWQKVCTQEVKGREVDTGHYIPEGKIFTYEWSNITDPLIYVIELDTEVLLDDILGFFKV